MINWADNLIIEYEEGRRALQSKIAHLSNSELDNLDKTQLNSMISDMTFAIDWLKTGTQPGNRRGVDRRSIYQRQVLVDMDLFPSLDLQPTESHDISDEDKEMMVDILTGLSHRERQCFILHSSYMMSMSEIERELNIRKSSVQKYIERARKKISNKISCHTDVV